MNIILFNGPPRSGKDTAALIACNFIDSLPGPTIANWEKFSYPLKSSFACMVGAAMNTRGDVLGYEERKNEPLSILNGASFRQFQIDFSEKFMKPLYGNDIFGRLFLERCKEHPEREVIQVVSDCGFQIEADALKGHNVCLFTLTRKGTSFEGDSRQYVTPHEDWYHFEIENDGTVDDLLDLVEPRVEMWLKQGAKL